jgi:hypothetical protein
MAVRHLLLAVAALGLPTSANATRFVYSGMIDSYVAPTDGVYRILARGAGGGTSLIPSPTGMGGLVRIAGGNGGIASGLFQLSAGTMFSLVVGGAGSNGFHRGSGGGGGSFVFIGGTPYVVGGGGGGGSVGAIGQSVSGVGGPGSGGFIFGPDDGASGAGWLGNGQTYGNPNAVGKSAPSFAGGSGEPPGGFGGGGSGNAGFSYDYCICYGGGGGGGYTGGNAEGGAGTSYVAPFSLGSNFTGGRRGDGLIIISKVPEPESWALLVIGFGVVGGTLRARRRQLA